MVCACAHTRSRTKREGVRGLRSPPPPHLCNPSPPCVRMNSECRQCGLAKDGVDERHPYQRLSAHSAFVFFFLFFLQLRRRACTKNKKRGGVCRQNASVTYGKAWVCEWETVCDFFAWLLAHLSQLRPPRPQVPRCAREGARARIARPSTCPPVGTPPRPARQPLRRVRARRRRHRR